MTARMKRRTAFAFGVARVAIIAMCGRFTQNLSVPVRGEVESNESFMIPWGGLILEGVADVDERKSCSLRP